MYGETGDRMRTELAALLRQHRVQYRLDSGGSRPPAEREAAGRLILRYRHTVLAWCAQAVMAAKPLVFSSALPAPANPFRASNEAGAAVSELARALHVARDASTAGNATLELLSRPSDNAVVELWRGAASAAALAEHDTNGLAGATLTAAQAEALVGDVAAVTQALVMLDHRYANTPGWERLADRSRLGWAALATALDVSLGQPDYSVDRAGWRPRTKVLRGPVRPGVLGVLQAEHNLLVHLRSFPNAVNLRLIVDSQRQVSHSLAPLAERVSGDFAARWIARGATYAVIQQQLRNVGGRLGHGGPAVGEAANATARLRALSPDTIIEPRVLAGFQTLFDLIDDRVADIVEDGIDRGVFVERIKVAQVGADTRRLIFPTGEKFVPVSRASDLDVVRTLRERLRPSPDPSFASPRESRADLHTAILHRPSNRGANRDVHRL
ncbi:hypothetical protein [Nocardioides ultimimeridianus]